MVVTTEGQEKGFLVAEGGINGQIHVMMSGLPGKMAGLVAEYVERQEDMELFRVGLTGEDIEETTWCCPSASVSGLLLYKPDMHESILRSYSEQCNLIIVDFTQPDAVNRNAELYARCGVPFVMGTTGGDRNALEEVVRGSNISAVIAPNMATPIVLLQAMMEYAAESFPGALEGYSMEIVESHQEGKKDTSGTAKQFVGSFNELGIRFSVDWIKKIREPQTQIGIGVPREYLNGHAYHTYRLNSNDGTVHIELTHNVGGRNAYAEGTLSAIRFLNRKLQQRLYGDVYSMTDVLRGI